MNHWKMVDTTYVGKTEYQRCGADDYSHLMPSCNRYRYIEKIISISHPQISAGGQFKDNCCA